MKKLFTKMKEFFKQAFENLNAILKGEDGAATITFIIYLFIAVMAVVFFIKVFTLLPADMAFFIIAGSWASVEIVKHFIKDFIGLIKFYFKNKNI